VKAEIAQFHINKIEWKRPKNAVIEKCNHIDVASTCREER
jgi:hypothetical protein